MLINKDTKKHICDIILKQLNEKIETAVEAINSAKESRNNDTKSSAGDKYETGREMMQIEIEKNEVQLNKIITQKKELSRISYIEEHNTIKFGSLVQTNLGLYFISIGLGKIKIKKEEFYAISLASPIGQAFKNKNKGEKFLFQGREYTIENLF